MFDYFKKADLKKTNFDMSNHSPYTCNMGELLPTYSDAVLAGDEWKMRIKETIKTAPFVAPSLIKLSNSNYGFFTPNQCIWHHWNDFVTNGSMVQDTVLSANNKSEIDSVYKWPSIPANLLQMALKVANGYALPVFSFSVKSSSYSVINPNAQKNNGTIIDQKQLEALLDSFVPLQIEGIDNLYCFPYSPELLSALVTPTSEPNGLFGFDGSMIGATMKWLMFADEVSSEISLSNPPVKCEWSDVLHYERKDGKFVNPFFVKHPSFTVNDDWLAVRTSNTSPTYSSSTEWRNPYTVADTTEFDSVYVELTMNTSDQANKYKYKKLSKSQITLATATKSVMGATKYYLDFDKLINADNVFRKWINDSLNSITVTTGSAISKIRIVEASSTDYITSHDVYEYAVADSVVVDQFSYNYRFLPSHVLCPNPYADSVTPDYYFQLPVSADYLSSFTTKGDLNIALDLASDGESNITHTQNGKSFAFYTSVSIGTNTVHEHYACGYSALGFLRYCCEKVSRLVEYFDINIDGLICRSFIPYLAVEYNALPFMAYSKIWNDYFRNTVLQSPELDYGDANGLLFNNDAHNIYMDRYLTETTNHNLESDYYYVPQSKGWVLPVHNKPLEFNNGSMAVIRIGTYTSALALITGCNISSIFPFDETSDDVFLPSYYNALCAVKYKNIGRSIYTSGMLEPTNGAKIEEIPDTVIELRSATALQKFWEKTAVARTIKKWYQGIFGTTPSHDDYDSPLLLGKASSSIQVGEILQQSQTTDTSALGDRAGVALGGCNKGVASHYFNEHGVVMILSSVTMDISFVDGELPYTKALHSYLDLPYEQFAHIGNEGLPVSAVSAVPPPRFCLSQVNFSALPWSSPRGASMAYGNRSSLLGNAAFQRCNTKIIPNCSLDSWIGESLPTDQDGNINTSEYLNSSFSYTSRYAQWKIKNDSCHGEFRRDLSHWVGTQRLLGSVAFTHFFVTWEFRERNFDLGKFFAYLDGDKFYIDRYNDCSVIRALPFASTPQ